MLSRYVLWILCEAEALWHLAEYAVGFEVCQDIYPASSCATSDAVTATGKIRTRTFQHRDSPRPLVRPIKLYRRAPRTRDKSRWYSDFIAVVDPIKQKLQLK